MNGYNPTIPIGIPYGTSGPTSPINTGPQSPFGTGSSLPGSGNSPFTSSQQSAIQSAFSAAGIWETVQNLGGDVWGAISNILPKNKDGSIDWGGALKDIGSWVSSHKADILDGLNVYNQYERSQKSDKYAQQALDLAKERYDSQAPLRTAGQAGMLAPGAIGANTAALTKQGQNGLQLAAPQPVRAPTLNLANAQTLATGGGANPFTKSLPQAPIGLPLGTAPGNPGNPGAPGTPGAPGSTPPTAPTQPTAPTAPLGIAPTPAQLEGPHIPSPFSDIPDGFGVTRKPGQLIKPLPLATR